MTRLRPSWLALAYAVLYAAGYFSRPVHAAVAIWPAQALGFALFALLPARRWPSMALALIGGELVLNPLMHWLSGSPQNNLYALFGYALADVLTVFVCAALARSFGLLQPSERYSLIISPLWIPALLIGVAPGAILGALTREHLAGTPFTAMDIGLWGLAGVLAIVTMTPAILDLLLGYDEPARPVAKPWEGPVVAALLLGLSLWFAVIPWPALDALLQPMLFTVPLIWLALRFSQRLTNLTVAVAAVGISMLIDYRPSDVWSGPGPSWTDRIASVDLVLMIGCGGALLVNYMIFKQRSLLAELAREHDQLRQYAQALDSAEEAARRATAADLHDGIGQVLAGQSMTLAAMRTHAAHPKLLALLEEAIEAAREAQEACDS